MSLREKFAWVALLTLLVGICGYGVTIVLGYRYVLGHVQVLWISLGLVIATIGFPLAMRAVLAMRMPTGSMKEQDEREQLFELKATRNAFFVLAVGMLMSTPFVVHSPGGRADVVHWILVTTVVSYVVKFGVEIWYHRRGY